MSDPGHCLSCGLPLEPPGPGGRCPVCLLKVGLQATGAVTGMPTAGAETSGTDYGTH